MDLLADSPDAGTNLSINADFAKRFHHNKQRAEQHRLEERYGKRRGGGGGGEDDSSGSSSSSRSSDDTDEDSEGEEVTADVDAAILRTIAKIRGKDESIYDATRRVFDDYQRSRINELMIKHEDPAAALADATTAVSRGHANDDDAQYGQLAPADEERLLQQEVTRAFHNDADVDDDDDAQQDFFTKGGAQPHQSGDDDSQAYRAHLLGALGANKEDEVRKLLEGYGQAVDQSAPELSATKRKESKKPTSSVKKKREEKQNEDFLTSYILNRGWIDRPEAAPRAHVASSSRIKEEDPDDASQAASFADGRDWEAEAAALASEDEFDDRAEAYENAYNFRFEALEAGKASEQIQSYARNPQGSARRQDTKRKDQRAERDARKQEEKRQKMGDLKRLAELKQRDVIERLRRLREVTGSSTINLEDLDLEGDFDSAAHDRAMQRAFDDEYYNERDDQFGGGKDKPTWDEEIDLPEHVAEVDDEEIEMDADFMSGHRAEQPDDEATRETMSKKDRKKLKKKLKAAEKRVATKDANGEVDEVEMDADRRPESESHQDEAGQQRELDSALDSYYNANYEDVIGDQPTRFKYEPVARTDYGLSAVEILLADDNELNGIVGLKHIQPYRRGRAKPHDLNRRLKEFRSGLQQRYGRDYAQRGLGAVADSSSATREAEERPRKRMGKKERNKRKAMEGDEVVDVRKKSKGT
ncbi:KRR1-interacting protein involved in 40S ribosome biogenesis [Ceraceosorus bombacis]|uniref:KRR1-interacting protein involved in 40S ribosome biogenesis n=1 Tax=Ceraceosorus bombacis TaxID=401625 RepID=A0A0N7LB15_9BASI|nr:KRR1-interacting protein involved in 40S ribosome biogenesis [Ceraceosorus bombacis]